MMNAKQAETIWKHIEPVGVAMLSTWNDGRIHARPMHNIQDEFDGTLWFFTSREAHAALEVEGTHTVGITYEDPQRETYVSLSGKAKVTRDPALIENFWNPLVAAYFPEGREGGDVALIEVEVERAEYWEATANRMVQLYELARASLHDEEPDLGRHEKFS